MSKYKNVKTKVHGITFHSKKEADRYLVLNNDANTGKIVHLELQKVFFFEHGGKPLCYASGRKVKYICDFYYKQWVAGTWVPVVEDVKGVLTDVYKLKKALMKYFHNIDIYET